MRWCDICTSVPAGTNVKVRYYSGFGKSDCLEPGFEFGGQYNSLKKLVVFGLLLPPICKHGNHTQ